MYIMTDYSGIPKRGRAAPTSSVGFSVNYICLCVCSRCLFVYACLFSVCPFACLSVCPLSPFLLPSLSHFPSLSPSLALMCMSLVPLSFPLLSLARLHHSLSSYFSPFSVKLCLLSLSLHFFLSVSLFFCFVEKCLTLPFSPSFFCLKTDRPYAYQSSPGPDAVVVSLLLVPPYFCFETDRPCSN